MKFIKNLGRLLFCAGILGTVFFLSASPVFAAGGMSGDVSAGMAYLAAAISTGVAGIGGGIAVGAGAPAAIGALTEDPKSFGKSIIFVALGEGIALYGMLIAILILNKV